MRDEQTAEGEVQRPLASGRARRGSRRQKVLLVVVFLAGVLAGLSIGVIAAPDMFMRRISRARGGDMTQSLIQRLSLRPEQDQAVRAAIAPHAAAIRGIMHDSRTRVEAEIRQTDHDVMPLLDADQQARWRRSTEHFGHSRSHPSGDADGKPQTGR